MLLNSGPTQIPLLESAASAPENNNHYHGQTDLFQLAGILGERTIKNHAFQDGNKRTALIATDMFLKINGVKLIDNGMERAHSLISVAENKWTAEELSEYYRSIAKPMRVESGGKDGREM
ncbi:Fic/DOC family [Geosmithia morbida]|uniref:Fic/DOC family n=1 Tax=Geosmithia morbida TaxID=1094350 RepID=A0A9P4YN41_9HYPO|nr:Fic/DOC family [Geosmithia morbida]KAF4120006.1 Fic/DOC family [Geosmithia morbida]